MSRKISFSWHERELMPALRHKLKNAETIEDIRKAFHQMVKSLLQRISNGKIEVQSEDIRLDSENAPGYRISKKLQKEPLLRSLWTSSDLPHVIRRFAEPAIGRYKRLEKHPEKTEAKIRM